MISYETQRHCGGVGSPPSYCRGSPIEGENCRGSREGCQCLRDERQTLEKSVAGAWHGGTCGQAAPRAEAQAEFIATKASLFAVASRTAPGRVRHGVMDLCASGTSHQTRVR